jgi:carboxylesterase
MPEPPADPPAPTPAVWPEAEPWSAPGGPDGVLVIHGYTGSPHGLRGLAQAFARAGFAVELPRLSGHGTSVDDLIQYSWPDWRREVEAAYAGLAARCRRTVVAGLSMGGSLAVSLCIDHPEIAGLVAVNPAVEPPADSFLEMLDGALAGGVDRIPGIGSDIADPDVKEISYDATPVAPLRSMMEAVREIGARLDQVRCPVLLFTSVQDHVVPPSSSDLLAATASGPVERVLLDRSYHVATMDYDKDEIERRAVDFARKVTAS